MMKGIERQTLIIFSKTLYRGEFFKTPLGPVLTSTTPNKTPNTPAINAVQKTMYNVSHVL